MNIFNEHFESDIRYLGRLNKLHQNDIVLDYITTFEKLAIHTEGLSNYFFIIVLKEEIYAHVLMQKPSTWLEAHDRAHRAKLVIDSQHTHPSFPTHTMSHIDPNSNISTTLLRLIFTS